MTTTTTTIASKKQEAKNNNNNDNNSSHHPHLRRSVDVHARCLSVQRLAELDHVPPGAF